MCVSPTVVRLGVSKLTKRNKMADTHKDGGHVHIRGVGQGLRHAGCLFTFFMLYVAYFVYARRLQYIRGRRPFLAPATNLAGVAVAQVSS